MNGEKAIGEASTTYSANDIYPDTSKRISKHLPNVRIIYIVRNPLSRIESLWMQFRDSGQRVNGDFIEPSFNGSVLKNLIFIETGLYNKQLNIYRRFVRGEKILVLFFDDLVNNPQVVLKKCFKFLDVDKKEVLSLDDIGEKNKNPWRNKKEDTFILGYLRRVSFFGFVRDVLPLSARNFLRFLFKRKFKNRPRWNKNVRKRIIEVLREDNLKFLRYCGKDNNYWKCFSG